MNLGVIASIIVIGMLLILFNQDGPEPKLPVPAVIILHPCTKKSNRDNLANIVLGTIIILSLIGSLL
jgi:hypothetical protein